MAENNSEMDTAPNAAESNSKVSTEIGSKLFEGKISVKAKIGDRSTSSNETMPTLESLEPETNG